MNPAMADKIESPPHGVPKTLSAMTLHATIKLYLAQRFNFAVYCGLALYLLLFTKDDLMFTARDVVSFVIILLFLLSMRLYDDLQNVGFDQQKPERIYTNP